MERNCRSSHVEKLSSQIGLTCMHRLCHSYSTAGSVIRHFYFWFNTSYNRLRWNISNIISWCSKPAAVVDVSIELHVVSASVLLLEEYSSVTSLPTMTRTLYIFVLRLHNFPFTVQKTACEAEPLEIVCAFPKQQRSFLSILCTFRH